MRSGSETGTLSPDNFDIIDREAGRERQQEDQILGRGLLACRVLYYSFDTILDTVDTEYIISPQPPGTFKKRCNLSLVDSTPGVYSMSRVHQL